MNHVMYNLASTLLAHVATKTTVNWKWIHDGSYPLTFNIFSLFQLKKLQDRVAKSKEAVNRTRDAYKAELQDLNRYNPQVDHWTG